MRVSDWKQLDVTQEVYKHLRFRVEALKEELANSAGVDPLSDRYRAGYIRACLDFLDTSELEESHGN